jgi:hypothetical protein
MLSPVRRQSDPSRDKGAQHMAMGEQGNISFRGARLSDDPIHSSSDLLRRLAARSTVAEDQPTRSRFVNLLRGQSFVLAVIPLHQIALGDGSVSESGQRTGFPGALQRAHQHEREGFLGQRGAEPLGKPAPIIGERYVGRAGVLTAQAPRGLTVPDYEYPHAGCPDQTLSASVELPALADASSPQRQPLISGMSSPYRAMYSRCSMSLSRIACLA